MKKIIVYNFLIMLNFKILIWHKYKNNEQNYRI